MKPTITLNDLKIGYRVKIKRSKKIGWQEPRSKLKGKIVTVQQIQKNYLFPICVRHKTLGPDQIRPNDLDQSYGINPPRKT